MTARDDAYKPFIKLRERFKEIGDALGLEVHRFSVDIDDPQMVHVVWLLKPDAVMTQAEKDQREVDLQFNNMMSGFSDPLEAKAALAKEELLRMLNEDDPSAS